MVNYFFFCQVLRRAVEKAGDNIKILRQMLDTERIKSRDALTLLEERTESYYSKADGSKERQHNPSQSNISKYSGNDTGKNIYYCTRYWMC